LNNKDCVGALVKLVIPGNERNRQMPGECCVDGIGAAQAGCGGQDSRFFAKPTIDRNKTQ
jgi:hypothetical protein